MTKVFVFDFDGTLVDSMGLGIILYNKVAPYFFAKKIDIVDINELRDMTYSQIMQKLNIRMWNLPLIIYFVKKLLLSRVSEINFHAGIIESLKILKSKNIKLGILTSNRKDFIVKFLESKNCDLFDFVISEPSLFGKDKAITKLLQDQNLGKEQIIYFGDEPRDIVSWGFAGLNSMIKSKPDLIISNTNDLVKKLDKIKNITIK